ncbi:ninjurin-2 isoform X1 [Bombyx mandarina]|uniref:Ninjurin-2 isoform X1 n=1 Tax=Bombyx mandarina TaxID=7092 RepID=A0A6J2KFY4_BOMMA|nr:ninjurin-2 isoform X1 [Bombyx mandarina]
MAAILPTGLRNGMKGLDANRYATKKTVAQGMLDIALLTSNASQLKYVLQVGPKHEFYTLLVVLISISIVLQLLVGLLFVIIGGLDLNDHEDQPSAVVLNDASAGILAILTSFLDVDHNTKQKKIADWLYHSSVGMMTGAVFCDVIKMNFGLDPALSFQDYYGNKTNKIA